MKSATVGGQKFPKNFRCAQICAQCAQNCTQRANLRAGGGFSKNGQHFVVTKICKIWQNLQKFAKIFWKNFLKNLCAHFFPKIQKPPQKWKTLLGKHWFWSIFSDFLKKWKLQNFYNFCTRKISRVHSGEFHVIFGKCKLRRRCVFPSIFFFFFGVQKVYKTTCANLQFFANFAIFFGIKNTEILQRFAKIDYFCTKFAHENFRKFLKFPRANFRRFFLSKIGHSRM